MRCLLFFLVLSACASNRTDRYLLITETYHRPLIWSKFQTREACEQASRESHPDFTTRCISEREARSRRWH